MDKILLTKLVSENLSIREISDRTNVSYTTIRYWLKKYEIKTNYVSKTFVWEKNKILSVLEKSNSKSDILRHLGLNINSGNFQTLDKYCNEFDIDLKKIKFNFKKHSKKNGFQRKLTNSEIFILNKKRNNNRLVKTRIIEENLLDYTCQKCGLNDIWMGEKITLQLDHINGDRFDNRLGNLRFLCPNCHSQTKTYGSKNRWSYQRGQGDGLKNH